ncbi:MAG TPA: penicillin acylase family protein [Acetobacteraceae bacterium]|nr:penicillin acylase family protein [Acetobacteraceae bacterium]
MPARRLIKTAAGIATAARVLLPRLVVPPPRPDSIDVTQRLAALPHTGLPLRHDVTIRWNRHQVPFIEADSDDDLATAFGIVHVHLRWTQMELMRHVAHGRVAELLGPPALSLDRLLRTLDFGRAVPAIVAALPRETERWLHAYVAGLNHAVAHAPVPPDFPALGLTRTPWTLADVLTVGRLASADATWRVWLTLLPWLDDPSLTALWSDLLGVEGPADAVVAERGLDDMLSRFTRQASNALAVAPSRSRSGAAWLAGDTHLPVLLPNLWLVAGCRAPSMHAVGLMVAGIPAIMLGRTPHIAWGGTNLHAASSDVYDVTGLPPSEITTRREALRVRGARDRACEIRETAYGPIISDLPALHGSRHTVALRWMGHRPSDEVTALLRVARARSWQEFRDALEPLAVPGQNMLYADGDGHIGKVMAVHLPTRPDLPPPSLLLSRDAADDWEHCVTGSDLPVVIDPPDGFVASANEKPDAAPVRVGWFFSSGRRIGRLKETLRDTQPIDFAAIAAIQQDMLMPSAGPVRDRLLPPLRRHAPRALAVALDGWDLRYAIDSKGALAFELLLCHLCVALNGKRRPRVYSSTWNARGLIFDDIMRATDGALAGAMRRAGPRAARALRRFGTWGQMHRIELRHLLGAVPGFGRRYRFAAAPAAGGNDTLLKTGNPLTARRHHCSFASTARYVSDMADPDANWFVLLGGQDGWLGSTTLVDQAAMYQRGDYIRMPLRPETVRAEFPFRTILSP